MKDKKTKERFVKLRAEGMSYDRIARKIHVSKQTLIDWSKEYEFLIRNLKAIELEVLQEKYFATKRMRIELFGDRLNVIKNELAKRDFSNISTEKLFELLIRCSLILKNETESAAVFVKETSSIGLDSLLQEKFWNG